MSQTGANKKAGRSQAARKTRPVVHSGWRAVGRNFRASPDKVRLMGRAVIGLGVERALDVLTLSPNKSARILAKLVKSATHNAEQNFKANVDKLRIHSVCVDRASMLKRYHPCAHGRAKPILKRSCHVTVQLRIDERAGSAG